MHARWRPTAVAVASGLTIGLMVANTGTASSSASPPTAPDRARPSAEAFDREAPAREVHQVTLITGDRVSLLPGPKGTWRTSVQPGKGREVSFRTFRTDDEHYVIPSDMAALVAKGTLDRRLFNVAGLAADGYDDRDAKAIPLIVTYRGTAGRSAVESSGADQTRRLPSINGAAVRVAKNETAAFLESVVGSRAEARLTSGVEKIWLDGKRKPLLEQSVPQIGAPAAWEAGYTGAGVKVAVLDGGVEGTHPDLTGQVTESKNFSESPDGDPDGHGTHVAGTVTGTGSASDGRRKGVAPDATILDGKVCEDGSGDCYESAILAGMQWAAAEQDADIINLSLGSTDTPEIDPIEEAVNTLTEQTGALFVISSGNSGSANGTVGSPGSAEAALTVGAVDKSDELAWFSSRGPRVGDGGIKPDITAPGVDIVAAKSGRAWIGEPVDEHYMRLSGTSMAAPHVAGAAALLAHQHPDWEATELKAALMGSAKPHPDQTVFEQGAGRVDVAAAIEQSVFATTPSLSFGTATWPHDDDVPVTKTVTYRNTGNAAATLELAANLTGPEGEPAPDSAISLSATELTIPAGGEASIQVTGNTNHDGPDGLYSGRIVATDEDGRSVSVPAGVHKEIESYDLTLRHIGPDGAPTATGVTDLLGLDVRHYENLWEEDGEITTRLPKGRYHLDTLFRTTDDSSVHHIGQPVLTLDKETRVDVDARTAKPVTHSVPDPDAVRSLLDLGIKFKAAGGTAYWGFYVTSPDTKAYTRSVGGPRPDDEFIGSIGSHWSVGSGTSTPSSYVLFDYRRGGYLTGTTMTPEDGDFATVVSKVHAPGEWRTGAKGMVPVAPGDAGSSTFLFGNQLPATTTEYLYAAPGVKWSNWVVIDGPPGQLWAANGGSPDMTYQAGRTYRERWNGAVLGPDPVRMTARRTGDKLVFGASATVDSGRHAFGYMHKELSTRLFRNGQLLAEAEWNELFAEGLPAESGDFRLEFSSVLDQARTGPLSKQVDSVWTFSSAASDNPDGDPLPLWSVRYQPKVDDYNKVKRQAVTRLPIRVESELGEDAAKLRRVVIEISGDDGKTWQKASVKRTGDGSYLAIFKTPPGEAVSLRASVADKKGNTAKQTIIAAYLLR